MFTSLLCGCLPALWPLVSVVVTHILSRSGSRPSERRQTMNIASYWPRWKSWGSKVFSKRQDSTLHASESRRDLQKDMDRETPTGSWKRSNIDEEDIVMMPV